MQDETESDQVWLKNGSLFVGREPGHTNAVEKVEYDFFRLHKVYFSDERLWKNEVVHVELAEMDFERVHCAVSVSFENGE